jgi:hypothetical protein
MFFFILSDMYMKTDKDRDTDMDMDKNSLYKIF